MALLVTGATGHVGQEIVRQAVARGRTVVAASRTGKPPAGWSCDVSRVVWTACELADWEAVSRLAEENAIDACIHGAAISNEAFARPDPHRAINTNVLATANLLEAARARKWRRFMLVSTGSVFQCRADTETPILEHEPPAPRNIYSTTKASAEMLVRMYRTEFALSAASVRISWVFGPPIIADAPTRGPVPSYLLRAMRGEAIKEAGGDFAASFTFVSDVAAGLIAAAAAELLSHDVYHLGPGRNFSAYRVAQAVRAVVPDAKIELSAGVEPWTTYTAMRAPLAGTRLRDDIGFEPQFSLDAGIAAYAAWMRDHPQVWC